MTQENNMTQHEASQSYVTVTLVKSVIGTKESHRATVRGLGLRRINSSRRLILTPAVSGMIRKVRYLLEVDYKS